ncbi:hypothetical protein [Streptomyces laculatispora]|uniref:hypothetical protein n=1 Tax=Streptomyces laculatispora TaxID=887464 RepID=UPI001A93CB4F|nr:hypothetical protein [Streptomyces laculatispora]MBO0917033.1 hypothetical protein [Streptomyces laculatispora]
MESAAREGYFGLAMLRSRRGLPNAERMQLYVKYGSWEKVVEAATRSSAAVDHELGLEFRHCSCEVLLAA